MSANLMRIIDRWVGIPLCFFLTLCDLGLRLFRQPRPLHGAPRKILFIELAENGALVVAGPALLRARELWPDASIHFLTFTLGRQVLEILGTVEPERIVVIKSSGLISFFADTVRAIRRLRGEGIDAVINFESFARFSTVLAYFTGAPNRVGFHRFYDEGRYMGDLITHKVIYNPHQHAGQTYLALVEALRLPPGGSEPLVKADVGRQPPRVAKVPKLPERQAAIRELLRANFPSLDDKHRLVLLNPNSSDLVATRRWPMEYFQTLGKGLLEDPEVVILITGAPDERPHSEDLRQMLDTDRVVNLAGRTTLAELIDLYQASHLLVTNDSGPAHFASVTDLPVLVLFGPETPDIFGPLGDNVTPLYLGLACSPCVSAYNQKRTSCTDNLCLKRILPEQVLARAREILAATPPSA